MAERKPLYIGNTGPEEFTTGDTIPAANIPGGGGSSVPIAVFQERLASNTAGGSFTSGDWRDRVLNTEVVNEIIGCTFNDTTGVVQLTEAGDYLFEYRGALFNSDLAGGDLAIRVYKVTATAGEVTDSQASTRLIDDADTFLSPECWVDGEVAVTIESTTAYKIQMRTGDSGTFGAANPWGTKPVCTLKITKVS